MIDIILFQVTTTQVRIKPKSAHGMLWLQTHFVNEDWDSIALGQADLKNKNADWIIANDVSKKDIGFNKDYNAVTIIRSDGKISQIKKNKKSFIASIISGEIIKKLLINDKSLN